MFEANRRIILQSIAVGASTFATSQSFAVGNDGHAAGYDVSAAAEYLKTIPRKSAEFVVKLPDGKDLLLSSLRGKVVCLAFIVLT